MENAEYLLKISNNYVSLEIILKKYVDNKDITKYGLIYGNCEHNKEEIYNNITDSYNEIKKIIINFYNDLTKMINVCKRLNYDIEKISEYVLHNNYVLNSPFNYMTFEIKDLNSYLLLEWSSGIISDDIKQLIKNDCDLLLCSINMNSINSICKYNTIITQEIYALIKTKLSFDI
jgi:hypothetical protein